MVRSDESIGRKIFAMGETVLDILFKEGQPVASKAGGSMLNTSVSLGRLGLDVHLITEVGQDELGSQVINFLRSNRVGTSYVYRFDKGSTALAIAFLDEDENASYSFYKNYPGKRLQVDLPSPRTDDIVLFGSSFSISPEVRLPLTSFLKQAKKAGSIIIYDPNFRPVHSTRHHEIKAYVRENMEFADIIRGSTDDFELIFDSRSKSDVFNRLPDRENKILIISNGAKPVVLRSAFHSMVMKVPQINPVSTIGAGDNFNAGLIYSIIKLNIQRRDILSMKAGEWKSILDSGITFGTIVCESYDNYIPESFSRRSRGDGLP